jgi:hypothetical protein
MDFVVLVAAHGSSALNREFLLNLIPSLYPLIERLQNTRVDGRNHIHRRVEFRFSHSRFPCVRKAPLHSRIAQPHHRHGNPH